MISTKAFFFKNECLKNLLGGDSISVIKKEDFYEGITKPKGFRLLLRITLVYPGFNF